APERPKWCLHPTPTGECETPTRAKLVRLGRWSATHWALPAAEPGPAQVVRMVTRPWAAHRLYSSPAHGYGRRPAQKPGQAASTVAHMDSSVAAHRWRLCSVITRDSPSQPVTRLASPGSSP